MARHKLDLFHRLTDGLSVQLDFDDQRELWYVITGGRQLTFENAIEASLCFTAEIAFLRTFDRAAVLRTARLVRRQSLAPRQLAVLTAIEHTYFDQSGTAFIEHGEPVPLGSFADLGLISFTDDGLTSTKFGDMVLQYAVQRVLTGPHPEDLAAVQDHLQRWSTNLQVRDVVPVPDGMRKHVFHQVWDHLVYGTDAPDDLARYRLILEEM